MPLILEGIVTSLNLGGELNIAPMGPVVDENLTSFTFRPFQRSQTYRNLKQSPFGVFHVVDDVYLLAQAAIDRWREVPATQPANVVAGNVLTSACRWYEFEVVEFDDQTPRSNIVVRIVHVGRIRDFWGLNRAKHAVLEAAILATRIHLLTRQELDHEFERLQIIVAKTAGPREILAFELLQSYVSETLSEPTFAPTKREG